MHTTEPPGRRRHPPTIGATLERCLTVDRPLQRNPWRKCRSLLLRRRLELAANHLSKALRLSPAAVARGEVEPPRLGQVLSRRPSKKMFFVSSAALVAVDLVPFLVAGAPNVGGWSSAEVAIFLKNVYISYARLPCICTMYYCFLKCIYKSFPNLVRKK